MEVIKFQFLIRVEKKEVSVCVLGVDGVDILKIFEKFWGEIFITYDIRLIEEFVRNWSSGQSLL